MSFSLMISAATFEDYKSIDIDSDIVSAFKGFGSRLKRRAQNQEKRDISLAYSATNISSKEGTQVKTITVIKNVGGDKNTGRQKINPEFHKTDDWTKTFKDNFNSYGVIPDVPDVDDLFEFVNKKHGADKNKKEPENAEESTKVKMQPKQTEKPVFESSSEEGGEFSHDTVTVKKIEGDAELLPNFNASKLKTRESLVNVNYSTPKHSVHQYFENYLQLNPISDKGYDYPKPCVHQQPIRSDIVTTPSGRTYNIPKNNTNNDVNPYLAPSITRKPQIVQQTTPIQIRGNTPVFPINSLLSPLPPQGSTLQQPNILLPQQPAAVVRQNVVPGPPISSSQQTNSQSQTPITSTSQRPYIAPHVRFGLSGVSRGPAATNNLNGSQSVFRINAYNNLFKKPNASRSRGLKY